MGGGQAWGGSVPRASIRVLEVARAFIALAGGIAKP